MLLSMFQPFCAPFGTHRVSLLQSHGFHFEERLVETKSFESYALSGRGLPDGSFPGVETRGLSPPAPSGRNTLNRYLKYLYSAKISRALWPVSFSA
jgi:hypothetical protein